MDGWAEGWIECKGTKEKMGTGCAGASLTHSPPDPAVSPGAISVQDSSSLDFEASPRLRLVVQAETAASFSFMAINLNLQDVNDNLPRFQLQNYVAFIWESQGYDSPVIQVALGAQTGTSEPLAAPARVRRWGAVP